MGVLWVCEVICTQLKFKKKGIMLDGEIVGYNGQKGNYFAIHSFRYEGEDLKLESHFGDKSPAPVGSVEKIYYLPGNKKGIMRENDVKIKSWQILVIIACIAYVVADLFFRK